MFGTAPRLIPARDAHRPRRGEARRRSLAALALAAALGALAPAHAFGQALEPPFDGSYSFTDIGAPPGVPSELGGLTLKAGTTDRLLIGGAANSGVGALYEVGVTRDGSGHISGFSGTATRFADAAFNDGGVTYGPGGVLFLARWPANQLGQSKPGSSITDKVIDLAPLGVAQSVSSVLFVPPGQPGAGSLKLASWPGGQWHDADVTPDGTGTYDLQNVTPVPGSTLPGGPEGFIYVNPGSPQFSGPNMLVSEYSANAIGAYQVDANGDPVIATRRTFISGLSGAEGAFIDPATGDFLFSTFGGGNRVIVVRGFAPPTPSRRMVGKGSVTGGGRTASYAYILNCTAASNTNAPFEVRFNGQRFRSTSTTNVNCFDDPAVATPAAGFDTMTGSGFGLLTPPGEVARVDWKLVDGGAGGLNDRVELTIRRPLTVIDFAGTAAPPGRFPGSDQATGNNTAQTR